MRINFKVTLLVFGPLLLWWIPCLWLLQLTHQWKSLLLPFVGFYPGPTSSPGNWHYQTLNLTLATIWGCLSLVGFVALAFCALRKNSQALALICAVLISLSSLTLIARDFWAQTQL
jgi:hypothetical protein